LTEEDGGGGARIEPFRSPIYISYLDKMFELHNNIFRK